MSRSADAAPGVFAGVGARPGVSAREVLDLLAVALDRLARSGGSGGTPDTGPPRARAAPVVPVVIATVEARAEEPGLLEAARRLGVPLRVHPAASLADVAGARPSARVRAAVGTPSVAEAAALLTAGPGAVLLVPRLISPTGRCTVAVAGPGAR